MRDKRFVCALERNDENHEQQKPQNHECRKKKMPKEQNGSRNFGSGPGCICAIPDGDGMGLYRAAGRDSDTDEDAAVIMDPDTAKDA